MPQIWPYREKIRRIVMTSNERSGDLVKFCIYLIVVILINIAGFTLFLRVDLTSNKVYSLSRVSKEVVSTLEEPLTIYVLIQSFNKFQQTYFGPADLR